MLKKRVVLKNLLKYTNFIFLLACDSLEKGTETNRVSLNSTNFVINIVFYRDKKLTVEF